MTTGGRPRHPDILTPRQWEVLELLREGLTNEEIAQHLGIAHDSAKFQVSEILGKLGVANRYEAASWRPETDARRHGTGALAPLAVLQKLKWNTIAATGAAAVTMGAVVAIALLIWGVGKTSTGGAGADAQAVVATATPGSETTPLVFDVPTRTLRSLPVDGLFYPLPLADRNVLVADTAAKHWEIIQLDGTIVKRLPLAWPDVYPRPSADGRLLAYPKDNVLHIYDVASGSDEQIDAGVSLADAMMVWSPDGRELAVALSKTTFDPLFVGVADIAAGTMTKRETSPLGGVSNIPQGADAAIVGWVNNSQFEYRVVSTVETDPFHGLVSQGGTLNLDSRTSGQPISQLDTAGPWSWCAGGCSPLPPAGFENPDGLVSWCSAALPSCRPVLGVVDRAAGRVRRLLDADTTAIVEDCRMSPDGKTLAVTLRDKTNHQRLRLVDVASGASHDYALPYVNEGHALRWSPDGQTILLYFPGT